MFGKLPGDWGLAKSGVMTPTAWSLPSKFKRQTRSLSKRSLCVRDRVQVSPRNRTWVHRRSGPLGEHVGVQGAYQQNLPVKRQLAWGPWVNTIQRIDVKTTMSKMPSLSRAGFKLTFRFLPLLTKYTLSLKFLRGLCKEAPATAAGKASKEPAMRVRRPGSQST